MDSGSEFLSLRARWLRSDAAEPATAALSWPASTPFNWARDYFDRVAERNERPALRVVGDGVADQVLSYQQLARRSNQLANHLRSSGVEPGDRVLIMLGNEVALWESMLAAMKIGAVMIPATTLLQSADLEDRLERGRVKAVITGAALTPRFAGLRGAPIRIATQGTPAGWVAYEASEQASPTLSNPPATRSDELMLLYFTSGTTSRPKLVAHTHASYPIGHLSTLYWLGLRTGDVHLNLSSPGWAKHAWSSFYAPWNAEATILAYHYERFHARDLLDQLVRCGVTTFCAPPTVWRMLIQEELGRWPVRLREVTGAGEPLNPEVIEQVQRAWGLTLRDGFGQTETTAQVGNPPGQRLKPGSMGRPLPGYAVVLLSPEGRIAEEGEICLDLAQRPIGLMHGYLDDAQLTAAAMRGGYYHTGDVARRDADGYLTYVGRTDDVFKSSDYRISPFELESVLIEHPAIAEAAVVPSPDALRLAVPKAFVVLTATAPADASTAQSIFEHIQRRVAPYQRIRRIEFAALPKTISGKIRRVELRQLEQHRVARGERAALEFLESDFPGLRHGEPGAR